MAAIPSNLARVPTMLSTQIMASAINGTNRQMLNLQTQLATGKAINRPSDSAAGTSAKPTPVPPKLLVCGVIVALPPALATSFPGAWTTRIIRRTTRWRRNPAPTPSAR